MGRRGNGAGWGRRDDHLAVPGERAVQLDAHLKVDLTVQVHRDMPTCPRDLLRADDTPHCSTGVRNDLGRDPVPPRTAHHRKRTTAELFESDVVFHAMLSSAWEFLRDDLARPPRSERTLPWLSRSSGLH